MFAADRFLNLNSPYPTTTLIYNNVRGAEDGGRYTSGDAASGVYQQEGKEEVKTCHTMRDLQIDRMNQMEKK